MDKKKRTREGIISMTTARNQDIMRFAAAQKSHASTLSLMYNLVGVGLALYQLKWTTRAGVAMRAARATEPMREVKRKERTLIDESTA